MNGVNAMKKYTSTFLLAALCLGYANLVHADPTAPVPDKGDVAWMMVSTILVILMVVPGLALFYGGLVRSQNMLSVLMQVMAKHCISTLSTFLVRTRPP